MPSGENVKEKDNLQILIVDDDKAVAAVLANALVRLYSTKTVNSVSDAMEILETKNVDILITDLNLFGESGITLAKIARKNDPNIEIIFITGYASFENARVALDLGVVAYMTKPIDVMELFSVVEKSLHSRRFNVKMNAFSQSISKGVNELQKHMNQVVSIYGLMQKMNQTIDIIDTVHLLFSELSVITNANMLIMGINCLGYSDIYAYSAVKTITRDTVVGLLANFWKREMLRSKLSISQVRDHAYPITLFNEGSDDPLPLHNNSCTLVNSILIFGEDIGFISVYHDVGFDIEEPVETSFYILTPLIAPALYRGYLEKKTKHLAQTDGLTGILNRRTFYELLSEEIVRAIKNKMDLSFFMIDIDFFKKINDTYGHLIGDDVLKKLTETVAATIRSRDTFARFGGEEFTVALSSCSIGEAVKLAKKIRVAVEKSAIEVGEKTLKFTISIGVSTFNAKDETIADKPDIVSEICETLVKNSDFAMYAAKQNSRNCVYYFDDETKEARSGESLN